MSCVLLCVPFPPSEAQSYEEDNGYDTDLEEA